MKARPQAVPKLTLQDTVHVREGSRGIIIYFDGESFFLRALNKSGIAGSKRIGFRELFDKITANSSSVNGSKDVRTTLKTVGD